MRVACSDVSEGSEAAGSSLSSAHMGFARPAGHVPIPNFPPFECSRPSADGSMLTLGGWRHGSRLVGRGNSGTLGLKDL